MVDEREYASLPDLRARAAAERAAGNEAGAAELDARIAGLTAAAKRDAARVVRERAETRDRFQRLVRDIRELQGSAAEMPGGPEARDARIRELTAEANAVKADHDRLNGRVRRFKWYLTGTGEADAAPAARGPASPAVSDEPVPPLPEGSGPAAGPRRRWWLIPAIAGGVLLLVAGGLFVASLVVDARLEERVSDRVAGLLAENRLDDVVSYDSIDVSSITGSVTAREVAITDPVTGDGVRADSLTLAVPRLEALRARDALAAGAMEEVAFSSLALTANGVMVTVPDGQGLRVGRLRLAVEGDLNGELLGAPLEDQVLSVRRAEATIDSAELMGVEDELLEELRAIGWMGDAGDFLVLDEARLVLEHDRDRRRVAVSDYRLVTPVVSQSGNAALTYAGDLTSGDAWLRDVEFDLTSSTPAVPEAFVLPGPYEGENVLVDVPQVDLTAAGGMSFADEWMEPELARMFADVTLAVGRGEVTLPPSLVEELAWSLPGAAEIVPDGRISVDDVSLEVELRNGGAVELRELTLDAPLAAVSLSGRAWLDERDVIEPGSLFLEGSVERMPESFRGIVGEFAMMMGAALPESGPFEFSLSTDEYGDPSLDVR